MTRLAAVIFLAMLAGNAMAQAGGPSTGAGGTGAAGATATTVGTVAVIAVMVGGVIATVGNTNPTISAPSNH